MFTHGKATPPGPSVRVHPTRLTRWVLLLLLTLCAGSPVGNAAPTLERRGGRLAVRTARYRAEIDPGSGGRIVSLTFDGVELTRLGPGGRGGLLEEVHSADFPYELADRRQSDDGLHLRLRCETRDMRMTRELIFPPDGAFLSVQCTFENRRPYALSGAAAPAMRNLVLPAGEPVTGRELYCLGRGRGAEVLSAGFYASRLHRDPGGPRLRWMAAAEPVARRVLGFALSDAGCRALAPVRGAGGALTLGWRCPTIPAGHRLTHEFIVVPLTGFTSLTELNRHFAADSLVRTHAGSAEVQLTFMPLRNPLSEVSIITRTYDADGLEGDPSEPMLFEELPRLTAFTGHTGVPKTPDDTECVVHEVYSDGRRLGAFAVAIDGKGTCAVVPQPGRPTVPVHPIQGAPPGGVYTGPPTDAERARGFTVRDPAVAERPARPRAIELMMAVDERRTRFLAIGALRDVAELRFTLAGPPEGRGMVRGIPPGAVRLWRLTEDGTHPAWLEPFTPVALGAGETRWLACTVDTAGRQPGEYHGRLSLSADGKTHDIPLTLDVLSQPSPAQSSFGLWYLGCPGVPSPDGHALSKLRGYGVCGLSVAADARGAMAARAAGAGFELFAHSAARGALPPSGRSGGRSLTDWPRPLWLLAADIAPPGAADVARRRGYAPLPLLTALTPGRISPFDGDVPHILVRDGCDVGQVPALIECGTLNGREHVWAHLDLCGADWRRAAVEVRSACWAAAWQGLAGVSVCVEPPLAEVDRQMVIWHILRDGRQEAALWRELQRAARRLRARSGKGTRLETPTVLALERLQATVGTADHCTLPLRARRLPFRQVMRVQPGEGERALRISRFETARATVLEAARLIGPLTAPRPSCGLCWQDVPLVQDGRLRWAIMLPPGGSGHIARRLQEAIRERTDRLPPIEHQEGALFSKPAPYLVWVVGDGPPADLPAPARAAVETAGERPIIVTQPDDGPVVVVLRSRDGLETALQMMRQRPGAFPTADQVR